MLSLKFKLPIAKPPWTGLGRKLESACRKALYEFKLIENTPKIAIALSGGKDSLTLLYLLHAISGRGFPPFQLYAIHVGGEFSCGSGIDSTFLQKICKELQVPLIIKNSPIKKEELECYGCSRIRRKILFDEAKKEGITTIAFGHHRDDNAQTLLLNLFHKGEFAGLLPKIEMIDFGVHIIRPLIFIAEDDIRSFAMMNHYARITCQCPYGQNSMRKKLDTLLTEVEHHFPNLRKNLAQASLNYGSDKANKKKNRPLSKFALLEKMRDF